MTESGRLSGVVLAGGASRRMGRDKALLLIDGEPMVARVARRIATLCDDVVVASGDGRRLGQLLWPQVADRHPGAGPLAGIVAGLAAARHPLVAVVAGDMPDASPEVLQLLAERWGGEPAIVPQFAGRVEPLHAVYAASSGAAMAARLDAGLRSVQGALAALGAVVVDAAALDPTLRFLRNLNDPADLP